ncbi:hypothetical protein ACSQ67_002752 [Phaseolus vulgaris]
MLSECDSKIAVDDAHSFDGPHDEVAYDIHGYYVLKSNKMVHSDVYYHIKRPPDQLGPQPLEKGESKSGNS